MSIQIIQPSELRLVAGGSGVVGRVGVTYQTPAQGGELSRLYWWDGEKHVPLLNATETAGAQALVSGAGIFGPYTDTTALQAAKPAASNPGAFAYVGASAPYVQYVSNGSAWVVSGGGTPGGSTTQLQFNDAGAFAGAAGLTWDKTTNTLTIASGTQTASNPQTVTQTWNNVSVPFVGWRLSIADNGSASGSVALGVQISGSDTLTLAKNATGGNDSSPWRLVFGSNVSIGWASAWGALTVRNAANSADANVRANGFQASALVSAGSYVQVGSDLELSTHSYRRSMTLTASGAVAWSSTAAIAGSPDIGYRRDAAGVLAIDNGTAGTYRDVRLRHVRTNATTVSSLVAAATAGAGARGFVTDATSATFGAAAVGGGANAVPVWCDGAGWFIG